MCEKKSGKFLDLKLIRFPIIRSLYFEFRSFGRFRTVSDSFGPFELSFGFRTEFRISAKVSVSKIRFIKSKLAEI